MKLISLTLLALIGNIAVAQIPEPAQGPLDQLTNKERGTLGGFWGFDYKNPEGHQNLYNWNKAADPANPDTVIYTSSKATVDYQTYAAAAKGSRITKEIPQSIIKFQRNSSGEITSVSAARNNARHQPRISWYSEFSGGQISSVTRCDTVFCVTADYRICAAVAANTGNFYDTEDTKFYAAMKAAQDPELIKRHRAHLTEMNKVEFEEFKQEYPGVSDGMVRIGPMEDSIHSIQHNIKRTRDLCEKIKFVDTSKKSGSPTSQRIHR